MRKVDITKNKSIDQRIKERRNAQNEVQEERLIRITEEFRKGFDFLKKYGKAATIFGSARRGFDAEIYEKTRKLAGLLAKENFTVVTGGGPGVMEAANQGAYEAGGKSLGINIIFPSERERKNPYVQESESFHYFFSRKVMLAFASQVYFFLPGGFGTLDEFFELVTLVQTNKVTPMPIILVHKEYWTPLLEWIEKELYGNGAAIDKEDMNIYDLVDTPEEAMELVEKYMSSL